ncbi:MAG: hypothetical protein R3C56_06590 [Pirellulaceae bacterium]
MGQGVLGDEKQSTLRVLCRSLTQLEVVLEAGAKDVVVDFHDIRQYRQAVQLARQAGAHIALATLRIHKPGEDGLFLAARTAGRQLASAHLSQLDFVNNNSFLSLPIFGNVTSPLTAEQLIQWGATRVTASYDLNRDQLCELAAPTRIGWKLSSINTCPCSYRSIAFSAVC